MKLSVTSYSFQADLREGKMQQADCVEQAAAMGFDAVEFTDIDGNNYDEQCENARRIRARADACGIPVCAYAIGADLCRETEEGRQAEIERLCRQVDVAAILGAPLMRHDVMGRLTPRGIGRSFDLALPYTSAAARAVTEYAATRGIRTCTENHGFIAQDSDRLERFFNAVAHNNFGLLVDIGNFLCVDEEPRHAVSRLAPYAIHAHLKDFTPCQCGGFLTRGARRIRGAVLGEGIVPVSDCIAILQRAGYDGYMTLEYEGAEPPATGIARGLELAQSLLA